MADIIPLHQAYGAMPEDWHQFDLLLGLTQDLLPVVSNPKAVISPDSKMADKGKTPSRYNSRRQVSGFPQWPQYRATPKDIDQWSKEPDYGICLQTRTVRALDIDVPDEALAQRIFLHISRYLRLPARRRSNSAKFLLAFSLPGDLYKRKFKTDSGIVEFLATGQQFIAVGTHPSGARYEWEGGLPDEFPSLTLEQFETLWADLVATFAIEDATEARASNRHQKLADVYSNDPVAQHLIDSNLVKRVDRDGKMHIVCPWEEEHTSDSGDSSTTYWPAHTGGYALGHFKCLHAHCEHRTDEEFKEAIHYADQSILEEFERIAEPAGEAEQRATVRGEGLDDAHVASAGADAQPLVLDGDDPGKRGSDAKGNRFIVEAAHTFAARPAPKWIVKNVLPQAEMGVLYGASGSGKTFFMLDLVAAIARGTPWRGNPVKQGRVVVVAAEGAGGFRNRLKAYAHQEGIALEDLPIGVVAAAPNMLEKADALDLSRAIVAAGGADIVVLDTFAQVMPGANENSGEDVGRALAHCKGIHRATGALVMLVHHSGKDAAKGARGWSGLRGAADVEIEVCRANDARVASVTKLKDGEDGAEFGFTLNTVVVGLDEDGDEVTSCVVQHNDKGAAMVKAQGRRPLGEVERTVMMCYDELEGLAGENVTEQKLIEAAILQLPEGEPGKRDTRRQRVGRAIKQLLDAKYYELVGVNLVRVAR